MIRDIIQKKELVSCSPEAKLPEVARLMAERNVGCVLILSEDGSPRGMITDRDLVVRALAENLDPEDTTVENLMTESLATCNEKEGLFDCIRKMSDAKVRRIPVVDDAGKAIGILSFGDLVAVLGKELNELTRTTTGGEESFTPSERPQKLRAVR